MSATKITGTGKIVAADFKTVTWTGRAKDGSAVSIKLNDAIAMSNIDLTMVEKDDTVATVTFTATYDNTDEMVAADADLVEPWEIQYTGGSAASDNIMLGAGVLTIGSTEVALTRGGSHFTVEREFREINADGDRGPVKGRIVLDGSRATLELNALTFLTAMTTLFPATNSATVQ